MLVRANSIARGHSAASRAVIEAILKLIRLDFTPVIPFRGTVSASGDLMPLAYIGGTIQGSPDIWVRISTKNGFQVVPATEALSIAGITPLKLGPKEGLSMTNGTSASAAVASLALYEANQLAVLSQVLTAMAVEGLLGNSESFNSFIAQVRPHPGQLESASNIRSFLKGSKLAKGVTLGKNRNVVGLAQDRYALRSATQWVGPQLEDLMLAERQLAVELNSTCDNPLVDVENNDVYSGANFQAASVTSAMEKARCALQMLAKMLFSQSSELINPLYSNGLPANLAADDPSLSSTMKGVDVNMASYMSELAYLAHPVSSHVQSAEMHNQPINSLALISARYTMQAVELTSMICASHLYVVCQALDLRAMHLGFLQHLKPSVEFLITKTFSEFLSGEGLHTLQKNLWNHIPEAWSLTGTLDAHERFQRIADTCISIVVDRLVKTEEDSAATTMCSIITINSWKTNLLQILEEVYMLRRTDFFYEQDTASYLGHASKRMYAYVRHELGVPFHQGFVEHPLPSDGEDGGINGRAKKTIGSWISIVYEALRSGDMHQQIMGCLEAMEMNDM
jgi:phenylalanine ammonia-lyase